MKRLQTCNWNSYSRFSAHISIISGAGVGKSTWINSVANYLAFTDIDDTIEKGLKIVIPDNFTTIDNDGNVHVVKFESKGNKRLH